MRFLSLRLIPILLSSALIVIGCATTVNQSTPPENYKGPIAAEPVIRVGDYWIFERGNSTRAKSTTVIANIEFPLWVGKTWRYDVGAHRHNQPPTTKSSPVPAWAECYVVSFGDITVSAGKFGAFQCDCQCHVVGGEGVYQEGCGMWSIWYVPEVKNIVKIKAETSANSVELVGYKLVDKISDKPPNVK